MDERALVKCVGCGGTYRRLLPDNLRYFHVCPPLTDAEVKAALHLPADDAKLTDAQRAALDAAPRVRPNHRDENIIPSRVDGELATIKSEGAGVVPA
jgi:hypothetical protein